VSPFVMLPTAAGAALAITIFVGHLFHRLPSGSQCCLQLLIVAALAITWFVFNRNRGSTHLGGPLHSFKGSTPGIHLCTPLLRSNVWWALRSYSLVLQWSLSRPSVVGTPAISFCGHTTPAIGALWCLVAALLLGVVRRDASWCLFLRLSPDS
jgi:hypothetical protein